MLEDMIWCDEVNAIHVQKSGVTLSHSFHLCCYIIYPFNLIVFPRKREKMLSHNNYMG